MKVGDFGEMEGVALNAGYKPASLVRRVILRNTRARGDIHENEIMFTLLKYKSKRTNIT
jgi:hypothetical protein